MTSSNFHPKQCLFWMEPPYFGPSYLQDGPYPFRSKTRTNKTSIGEFLSQYGLEVKTSSPPCCWSRSGQIEVAFVERSGILHGSTSYWYLNIAATVSNYTCHPFMGFGQILLVQLARNLGNTKLNDCIPKVISPLIWWQLHKPVDVYGVCSSCSLKKGETVNTRHVWNLT